MPQSSADIYRDFQANPTSVELALRYWNAFFRSEAPQECAGIDINDPSPRNWKAIVRLIAKLDSAQREPVIEVLKLLLQRWPTGSRPLLKNYVPEWPFGSREFATKTQDHWFMTQAMLKAGSAALCDTSLFRFSPQEYQEFLGHGHFQLRSLRQLVDGEFDVHGPFLSLRKLDLGVWTGLGPYLCSDEDGANESRLAIRQLSVSSRDQQSLERLFTHSSLRQGLKSLAVEVGHSDPYFIFAYDFNALESLELDLAELNLVELGAKLRAGVPDLEAVCSQFPELKQIDINCDFVQLTRDQQGIDWLAGFFEFCHALAPVSVRLESYLDEYYEFSSHEAFWRVLSPMVSKFSIDFDWGCFIPENFSQPNRIESVELIFAADWHHRSMTVEQAASVFCREFLGVERLKIESSQLSAAILADPAFLHLKNLRYLDCSLDFDRCKPEVFEKIAQLELVELKLTLCDTNENINEPICLPTKIVVPKLTLDLQLYGRAVIDLCRSVETIRILRLHLNLLTVDEFFEILCEPSLQKLEVLSLYTVYGDNVAGLSRFFEANMHERWRSLTLNSLIFLTVRNGFPHHLSKVLYEHFPSLLHIGEAFDELVDWPFTSW